MSVDMVLSWGCEICDEGGEDPKADSRAAKHTEKTGHATWARGEPREAPKA